MNSTIEYYNENAEKSAALYEAVPPLANPLELLPAAPCRILEIGCGSGRDAAEMLRRGYDVIALDGSEGILQEAIRFHPELEGRLLQHILPEKIPLADEDFSAIYSVAALMHLQPEDLSQVFIEIHRLLKTDGLLVLSVPAEEREESERQFTIREESEWISLARTVGLHKEYSSHNPDALGRGRVSWYDFAFRRNIKPPYLILKTERQGQSRRSEHLLKFDGINTWGAVAVKSRYDDKWRRGGSLCLDLPVVDELIRTGDCRESSEEELAMILFTMDEKCLLDYREASR